MRAELSSIFLPEPPHSSPPSTFDPRRGYPKTAMHPNNLVMTPSVPVAMRSRSRLKVQSRCTIVHLDCTFLYPKAERRAGIVSASGALMKRVVSSFQ